MGYPSQNNSPSCKYAKLDFDSDDDFNYFFSKLRCEITNLVRQTTLLCPNQTFAAAAAWAKVRGMSLNSFVPCSHKNPTHILVNKNDGAQEEMQGPGNEKRALNFQQKRLKFLQRCFFAGSVATRCGSGGRRDV